MWLKIVFIYTDEYKNKGKLVCEFCAWYILSKYIYQKNDQMYSTTSQIPCAFFT